MQQSDSTATSCIPLPAMVAAVWGAFLYEGLLSCHQEHRRLRRILDTWSNGCLELVIATCLHLPEAWAQISRKWEEEDCDFPGVFEYEVIAPLGTWLGDYLLAHNGDLPSLMEYFDLLRREPAVPVRARHHPESTIFSATAIKIDPDGKKAGKYFLGRLHKENSFLAGPPSALSSLHP